MPRPLDFIEIVVNANPIETALAAPELKPATFGHSTMRGHFWLWIKKIAENIGNKLEICQKYGFIVLSWLIAIISTTQTIFEYT